MITIPAGWAVSLGLCMGLVVALLVICTNKIRKVHLATYGLAEDVAIIRRETEAIFTQVQALMALERRLGMDEALPAMRGWAGSPDFLLAVAQEVLDRKPRTVVECSSGVSTIVIARCLQLNRHGHVFSLEHEPAYAEKTRRLLARHGLAEWASVLDAPLQSTATETPWYAEHALPSNLPPIEMLVVDGPPSSVAPLARAPALDKLRPRMAGRYVVMVDDADRPDELEMVKRWRQLEPRLKETRMLCEKGLAVLELES